MKPPLMRMDPQALYVQLGRLIETMPDLKAIQRPIETIQWLGRAHALVKAAGDAADIVRLKAEIDHLDSDIFRDSAADGIVLVLYRALASAELSAPASDQGSFIPAGNAFGALAAVGKVLGAAKKDLLIVDPYMDETLLTDFALLAPEKLPLRLFADKQFVKASLAPAAARWVTQHGADRPLTGEDWRARDAA